MFISCTKCRGDVVKNGHIRGQKQRYKCTDCGYQFTPSATKKVITEAEQNQVRKLMLEPISQAGISRVVGVSKSWLGKFIKQEYANAPADLNILAEPPTLEQAQADTFDDALRSLEKKQKLDASPELPSETEQANWAKIACLDDCLDDIATAYDIDYQEDSSEFDFFETFAQASVLSVLLTSVYGTKFEEVLEFVRYEADELWSFVQNKKTKVWVWLVLNKANRQIIGVAFGDRSAETAKALYDSIPEAYKKAHHIMCTDFLASYATVFGSGIYVMIFQK